MEKTGHRDVRSLQQYQSPSIEYKVEMSKAFDQVGMMHTSLATTMIQLIASVGKSVKKLRRN